MTNEQLVEVYKYYKPKAKRLGKEEYKYLIAIEREINKRKIKAVQWSKSTMYFSDAEPRKYPSNGMRA